MKIHFSLQLGLLNLELGMQPKDITDTELHATQGLCEVAVEGLVTSADYSLLTLF